MVITERAKMVEEFGKSVKNVAIYADNLSTEDAKSVAAFMSLSGKTQLFNY